MQLQYECLELSSAECRVKRAGERERELQRKRGEVSYKAGRRESELQTKRDKERAEKTRVRLREGVWGR